MKPRTFKNAVTKVKEDVTEILRQLMFDDTLKLSGQELRIAIYLINLKHSEFTYMDISHALNIDNSNATRGLKSLIKKNVVICNNDIISLRINNKYSVNKECQLKTSKNENYK